MSEQEGWDIEEIARTLGTEAVPHADGHYFGQGFRFLRKEIPDQLELYPERLAARYHTAQVYLELHKPNLEIDGGVRLSVEEGGSRTVLHLFNPEGSIIFSGEKAVENPAEPERPVEKVESREDNRVQFTGNIGRLDYNEGTGKLKMSVAIHHGKETVWKTVYFSGDRARAIVANHKVGSKVSVVAYERQGENRYKKPATWLNGAVVTTPKQGHTP